MRREWELGGLAAVWIAAGCGAGCSSSAGSAPPVDRNAEAAAVSGPDWAQLCDWIAAQLGGYGRTQSCGNGVSVGTFPDRATCLSHPVLNTCTATVGQLEDCVMAAAALPSLCSILTALPSACKPFFSSACANIPFL